MCTTKPYQRLFKSFTGSGYYYQMIYIVNCAVQKKKTFKACNQSSPNSKHCTSHQLGTVLDRVVLN